MHKFGVYINKYTFNYYNTIHIFEEKKIWKLAELGVIQKNWKLARIWSNKKTLESCLSLVLSLSVKTAKKTTVKTVDGCNTSLV